MTDKESSLLWCCVQQAVVLRRIEAALKMIGEVEGDVWQHEARYQRAIKDAGLEKEAKEIEERLSE